MKSRGGPQLLLAGIIALAAIAVVLFLARPIPSQRAREARADSSAASSAPKVPESLPPREESSREAANSSNATSAGSPSASSAATGALRLTVVDAKTRAPVPDLGFVVYRERGGYRKFAQGRTDHAGRADVNGLEEDVILVDTDRRPPFAARTEGVWLRANEARDLEIPLDAGGSVAGRVVDDEGGPIDGVSILLSCDLGGRHAWKSSALDAENPAARTGADGRFEIPCLAMHPSGIWIVDGVMRPERWVGETIFLRQGMRLEDRSVDVIPGERTDIGDLVLSRAATWSGTVVDAKNRPVAGALVSPRTERQFTREFSSQSSDSMHVFRIGPGSEGFRLAAGEVLTDSVGRFEIQTGRSETLAVWTTAGQLQRFPLHAAKSGERVDGIVLKLDAVRLLELELVDTAGERVIRASTAFRQPGILPAWRGGFESLFGRMTIKADLASGDSIRDHGTCDPDGIWRIQLETDVDEILGITIHAPGYEPVSDKFAGGHPPNARLHYVVQESPSLIVRLVPGDPSVARIPEPGLPLSLQACLVPPARRAELSALGRQVTCCGLGSTCVFDWRGEEIVIPLPVRDRKSFWVYASTRNEVESYATVATIGPFEPSSELHEIALDLRDLVARARPPDAEEPPPAESQQKSATTISCRIVDAGSHEGVRDAWIHVDALSSVRGRISNLTTGCDEHGRLARWEIPAGRWKASAGARAHRSKEVGVFDAEPGAPVDLGIITLDPLPRHRGRLFDSTGVPVTGASIHLLQEGNPPVAGTREDGSFELLGDLPSRCLLDVRVHEPLGGSESRTQRLLVEGWPDPDEERLELAPWRQLVVHVHGSAVDRAGGTFLMYACLAPGEPLSTCDHRAAIPPDHEPMLQAREEEPQPDARVFVFDLAAGRYQVYGFDALTDVHPTEVQVSADGGPSVIEVLSE